MKVFYSKKIEIANGDEINIAINDAKVGDVATAELWINSESGNYTVEGVLRTEEGTPETIDITKGIDFGDFAVAEEGEYGTRMLFIISDCSAVKVTGTGDDTLDVKVIF